MRDSAQASSACNTAQLNANYFPWRPGADPLRGSWPCRAEHPRDSELKVVGAGADLNLKIEKDEKKCVFSSLQMGEKRYL